MEQNNIQAFELMKIKGLDCYRLCIVHLVNYFRGEFNLCFWDMFQFRFQSDDGGHYTISDRLFRANRYDMASYAEEFYDIHIQEVDITAETAEKIILDCLEKYGPILITMRADFCVWLPGHESQRVYHSFILLEFNNGLCVIADPFYFTNIQFVTLNFPNITSAYKVNNVKADYKIEDYIPAVLERAREKIKQQIYRKDFDEFIDAFDKIKDLSNEYGDISNLTDVKWVSGLDRDLGFTLAGSRGLYAQFLMHISDYVHDKRMLFQAAKSIKQVENTWVILRNRLMHCYITGLYDIQKKNILKILRRIHTEETIIRNNLLNCL